MVLSWISALPSWLTLFVQTKNEDQLHPCTAMRLGWLPPVGWLSPLPGSPHQELKPLALLPQTPRRWWHLHSQTGLSEFRCGRTQPHSRASAGNQFFPATEHASLVPTSQCGCQANLQRGPLACSVNSTPTREPRSGGQLNITNSNVWNVGIGTWHHFRIPWCWNAIDHIQRLLDSRGIHFCWSCISIWPKTARVFCSLVHPQTHLPLSHRTHQRLFIRRYELRGRSRLHSHKLSHCA